MKPTRPDERTKQRGELCKESIMSETTKTPEEVRQAVRSGYGQIAKTGASCCGPASSCCGQVPRPWRRKSWPGTLDTAWRSWPPFLTGRIWVCSAGTPTLWRHSGLAKWSLISAVEAASTCSIAGKKVGATGRAIGVDMTSEMLAKARKNIEPIAEQRPGQRRVPARRDRAPPVSRCDRGRHYLQLRHQSLAR